MDVVYFWESLGALGFMHDTDFIFFPLVCVSKCSAQDVSTIDLNCGCPKRFSIHGGMGAALMEEPEKLCGVRLSSLFQFAALWTNHHIMTQPTSNKTNTRVHYFTSK